MLLKFASEILHLLAGGEMVLS